MTRKIKVCVTGGIASGKSYVSDKLKELGAYVIDADILARNVVEKGTNGLSQLVKEFGEAILNDDGTLNRSSLKQIAFTDKDKLSKLNGILHPLIREEFKQKSISNENPIELWVIPLYDGQAPYNIFDRVLVVDVPQQVQIERIKKRDEVSQELALKIIKSQPSRKLRLKLATDVIVNKYTFQKLDSNINQIYQLYTKLI